MANDKVSVNQVSPRLNQVLVSSTSPGPASHLHFVKPIASNSLEIVLGMEAEFFDRFGQRIVGKVITPMDENGMVVISTLFTPSPKPIIQKVKQGLRVDRKVSTRPRRGRQ
jgi:hypothetical protein